MKQVSGPLLAYLRESASSAELRYAVEPDAIALGAETWVFGFELQDPPGELAGPLVLRLFPQDADSEQARFEPLLVMERIAGKMMLDELFGGSVWRNAPKLVAEAISRMPRALARHQLALHALDAAPLERALAAASIPERLYRVAGRLEDLAGRIVAADLEGLRPGIEWLATNRPADPEHPTICHCDFLPPNLIVDGVNLVGVIDWSHLTVAHPEWDFANTRLRIEMNPLEAPRALQAVATLVRGRVTRVYESAYERERPIDRKLLSYYEVLLSMWMLVMVGEHRRAGPAEADEGRSPNLWLVRGNERPLLRHCLALAGLKLELP